MTDNLKNTSSEESDVATINQEFFRLESELDLFERTIDGIQFWELVRFNVHENILIELGHWDSPHNSVSLTPRAYAEGAVMAFRNIFRRNPFLSPPADVLFFGHQRRKYQPDGYWWDIWSDPIIDGLSNPSVLLEKPYQAEKFTHHQPTKTPAIKYLDLIEGASLVAKKLGFATPSLTKDEREMLRMLESEFEQRFSASLDIESIVSDALTDRYIKLPMFERILKRVNPDVAVVVVSYGQEPFVEACKRQNVPSIELQHGAVTPSHFGYHFPDGQQKKTFPDYFFAFGEFWTNAVDFPIPDKRVLNIGYPYLEDQSERYSDTPTDDSVVFISQGNVGERISKLAVELDETAPTLNIVYKLHPGEYARWEELYPWLKDTDIRVIDSDNQPLYELLAAASAQVGVNSTVLFEGFNFDLETYLVEAPGIEDMEWLLDKQVATLVDSGTELCEVLQSKDQNRSPDPNQFFTPNATENAVSALSAIADGRSVDEWR